MDFLPKDIENYAAAMSLPENDVLKRLNRETHARILKPRMLSGHLQGLLLTFISRMVRPQTILEIGTYTGYSALCLAEGLREGGKLHTIDHNEELEELTSRYIKEAGYGNRIIQHMGEAIDIIPQLDMTFDLVFIDADKENYVNYFNMVLPKMPKGGIILADNALWSGKVLAKPEEMDSETAGVASFNEHVKKHPEVRNLLLPFRDGIMMLEKI